MRKVGPHSLTNRLYSARLCKAVRQGSRQAGLYLTAAAASSKVFRRLAHMNSSLISVGSSR